MWPTLNGMMWHQILFCCHSPDICGTSSSHSLTSPGWYRRRSLISYLSFFQAQTLSVWPLFVSCDIKFISATKRLKGDGKTLSRFSLKRYFLSLENSTITILEVLMLNVFCDHPGVGFLSPTQWLGVVRVNISVIKILTEPGRDGTESKVQISPHSWYEAVNWSQSSLEWRGPRDFLCGVSCAGHVTGGPHGTHNQIFYLSYQPDINDWTSEHRLLSPVTRPVPPEVPSPVGWLLYKPRLRLW